MTVTLEARPVTAARLACAATLARHKLAVSAHSFRNGSARCAWKMPKTAHRKQLRGSLTVTTTNGATSRSFAGMVR